MDLPAVSMTSHLSPNSTVDSAMRRRSFDDAQSRLKCRKLLGIGGKEPSKVLQVLGRQEAYFINIPRGFEFGQHVVSISFSVLSLLCLLFPGTCISVLGGGGSTREGILCCRLLGAALVGISLVSWMTKPSSISSLRNMLMLQFTYCGIAAIFFLLFYLNGPRRSVFLIALTALHAGLASCSIFYHEALRQLNKPTPEKPIHSIPPEEKNSM